MVKQALGNGWICVYRVCETITKLKMIEKSQHAFGDHFTLTVLYRVCKTQTLYSTVKNPEIAAICRNITIFWFR